MMGEKETSSADLAKLYQGGATLAKTAAETGLGRFAVAYRLEKAGVERRNPGSPRKTAEEKGAFAKQRLKEIFGDSWPAVANPSPATKAANEKGKRVTVLDLVDFEDGTTASIILSKLNRRDFSADRVAGATDEQLRAQFGLTEEEIAYIRAQLKKNGFSS